MTEKRRGGVEGGCERSAGMMAVEMRVLGERGEKELVRLKCTKHEG